MSFTKKWSELSQDQQKSAKEQYGSRSAWQDAKARSQGYANRADKVESRSTPTPSPTPAPAPSPTPTPSQSKPSGGLSREQMVHNLASHASQNRGKMGSQWTDYTANMSTQERNALRKEVADASGDMRTQNARNYRAAQEERKNYVSPSLVGTQDLSARSADRMANEQQLITGAGSADNPRIVKLNQMAKELSATGQSYNMKELERHTYGRTYDTETGTWSGELKENKMSPGLYKEYGGYQNWLDNHSLNSGNFTGSKDIHTWDQIKQRNIERQGQTEEWKKAMNEKYSFAPGYFKG